jgi:hypothetical protein
LFAAFCGEYLDWTSFACRDIKQISGEDDTVLLEWATRNERAVLMPDSLPTGLVIEEILLLDECSTEEDWVAGLIYLPLR